MKRGVFARLRRSAQSSPTCRSYWHGRAVRVYLTSAFWNLRRKRLFTSVSRAASGLSYLTLAGLHLFSLDFWKAVVKRYESFTFLRGFEQAACVGSDG